MKPPYYELHVTLPNDAPFLKYTVEEREWKFSKIDGDPKFGAGTKCYGTFHLSIEQGFAKAKEILKDFILILQSEGYDPIRAKIETVVFDMKVERRPNAVELVEWP